MTGKTILWNTLSQAFAKIITTGTTFLITIIIAHYFAAFGFGEFTKVVTVVTLCYVFLDFGMNAVFLQEQKNISFSTLLLFRVMCAIVLGVVVNSIMTFLPYDSVAQTGFSSEVKVGVLLFSIALIPQAILQSSLAIFQYKKRYDLLVVATVVGSVVSLTSLFLIAQHIQLTLLLALGMLLLGNIVSSFVALFLTQEKLSLRFQTQQLKDLVKKSLPLGLMLLFNLLYFRADMIILSMYKSSFDVGIYGLSYRIFDFLLALPLFLSNSLYPYLLDVEKNNRKSEFFVKKYLFFAVVFSIILIAVFWFASPLFILIDQDFYHAIIPFRLLLLSLPLFFLTSILQWVLIAKKQQAFLLLPYLLIGVINVLLNVIFIPTGSYVAAAIITGVSEGLVLLFLSVKILFLMKNMQNGDRN